MSNYTYTLTQLHAKLDGEIRREVTRRFPDGFRLLRLKKLRLAVKDRLQMRMRNQQLA